MEEETEPELSESLADPMSVFFDLNEEMLESIERLRYILTYSLWVGAAVALGAIVAFFWLLYSEGLSLLQLVLGALALASGVASYYSHGERPFLDDYRVLAWGIHRANLWNSYPKIPEGDDSLSRLTKYIEATDERFGILYEKNPKKLSKNVELKGKSKKSHHFDLCFKSVANTVWPKDPIPEGITLLVRAVPKATIEDVKNLKKAAEDVIKDGTFLDDTALRVILLQTDQGQFSEDVIEYAGKNWLEYDRDFTSYSSRWSSPIELVAEDPSGHYRFGNCYFG